MKKEKSKKMKIIGGIGSTRGQCKYQEDRGVLEVSGEEGPMALGIFDGHVTAFASDFCRRNMRTVAYQLIQNSPSIKLDPTTTPSIKPITRTLDATKFVEPGVPFSRKNDDSDSDDDDDDIDDDLIFDVSDDATNDSSNDLKCSTMEGILKTTFKVVNESFLGELEDGGCTACFAVVVNDVLWVANAGDSRCVVVGPRGDVILATKDHKPSDPAEKARIVAAGHTVEEEVALVDGRRIAVPRVDGNLACARTIGDADMKDFGVPAEEQAVTCVPDVVKKELGRGDVGGFVVLASDGLWDVMSNEQVAGFVKRRIADVGVDGLSGGAVAKVAQELVLHATCTLKSYDNTTAVIGVFV